MRTSVLLVTALLALAVVEGRPSAEPGSRRDGRMLFTVDESGDTGPSPRLELSG